MNLAEYGKSDILCFLICGSFHKVIDIQPHESQTEDETNDRGFLFCPCTSSHLISRVRVTLEHTLDGFDLFMR